MEQLRFSATPEGEATVEQGAEGRAPRLKRANRQQLELRPSDLETVLPEQHRARMIWAFVEGMDLTKFRARIRSREGGAGRPGFDPAVLLTLWLYAYSEGEGRAREVARRCRQQDAYRWICGGLRPNAHTVSDFRSGHAAALDDLLTQMLAVLAHSRIISLQRVAQDGMRVRASAGSNSFRRRRKLKEYLRAARVQVEAVKAQAQEGGGAHAARAQAARARAAQERATRVARALEELGKVEALQARSRDRRRRGAPRASITDPEARVMRMGDGGFRPSYNVQLASETEHQMVVGVAVTNSGSDAGAVEPLVQALEERTGVRPTEYLVDGGFATRETIDALAAKAICLYAPVPEPKVAANRWQRRPTDSDAVGEWRERMGTAEAKAIYKQRAATAELVNGDLRVWRGLDRFWVRGLHKTLAIALLSALSANLVKLITLTAGL